MSATKKLRLLKVVVQPTFVVDDGETLSEVLAEPVVVLAKDWAEYATGPFADAASAYERKINNDPLAID